MMLSTAIDGVIKPIGYLFDRGGYGMIDIKKLYKKKQRFYSMQRTTMYRF